MQLQFNYYLYKKKLNMGTRSTVKFYSEHTAEPVVCVYHQFDGYFEGVGKDLAEFLKGKIVINGFAEETMEGGYANGMGCLAAQYIAQQKKNIGGVYLTPSNQEEEFNYRVFLTHTGFRIEVEGFTGSPEEFLNIIKQS